MSRTPPVLAVAGALLLLSPTTAYAHGQELPAFLGSGLLTFAIGIPVIIVWRATSAAKRLLGGLMVLSLFVTWFMVATYALLEMDDRLVAYTIGMTAASLAPVVACMLLARVIRRC